MEQKIDHSLIAPQTDTRKEIIARNLEKYVIDFLTLDLYGKCNLGCWYCPVRYEDSPEKANGHMAPELVEKILANANQLMESQRIFSGWRLIYLTHFSDIFLYRHLEEVALLMRKYNFHTDLLTNAVAMTKKKIELISNNVDVFHEVIINIIAYDADMWAVFAKSKKQNYYRMLENIDLLHEIFPGVISICYNYPDTQSDPSEAKERVELLPGVEGYQQFIDRRLMDEQIEEMKIRWPKANVWPAKICDRAGYLKDKNIISQRISVDYTAGQNEGKKIMGCFNGPYGGVRGGQLYEFLHVTVNGDVFVCCNDYHRKHVFGNLKESSIEEVWGSSRHVDAIQSTLDELCPKCYLAKWE